MHVWGRKDFKLWVTWLDKPWYYHGLPNFHMLFFICLEGFNLTIYFTNKSLDWKSTSQIVNVTTCLCLRFLLYINTNQWENGQLHSARCNSLNEYSQKYLTRTKSEPIQKLFCSPVCKNQILTSCFTHKLNLLTHKHNFIANLVS